MNVALTTLGFVSAIPALTFWAWTLGKALLDIEAHRAEQDIARITGGWRPAREGETPGAADHDQGETPPEPAAEPLRRIDWIVDETLERILREATIDLLWIKAVEPVCA